MLEREQQEAWIRDWLELRYPELTAPYRAALDAFEASIASGVLAAEHLAMISECVCSRRKPLSENTARFLGELAMRFPEAAQRIRELFRAPAQHVRINVLVALSSMAPGHLHDDVLRAALKDRSSRIRELAADKIMIFGLTALLGDLEHALACEPEKTKSGLVFSRDLLRDGVTMRPSENGQIWVSCRRRNGDVVSRFVSSAEIERNGLQAIAREILADSVFGAE